MNTDLTTLKKKDDKKKNEDDILQKWTEAQENLLAEWSEKAACFRWLHSRSEKRYRIRNYSFTIPVIILSTLTGTANFAMDSFVPEDYKQVAMACVGGVNIFAGIISTLQNFLRYAELMETHRMCEVQWSKFGRNISVELALDPRRRKPANDFLKICRSEYDRLIEQSPPIDDPIINNFKKIFKNSDIRKPDICNGLDTCKIFEPSKEEKLENVMTNVSQKLMLNKKKKWNNVSNNTVKELTAINEIKHLVDEDKNEKNNSIRELDELKNISKVSEFKNKIKNLDNIKKEENPIDKIHEIVNKSVEKKLDIQKESEIIKDIENNLNDKNIENIENNFNDKNIENIENNLDDKNDKNDLDDNDDKDDKDDKKEFLDGIN